MSDTASRFEPIPTTPPRGLGETTPRYRLSSAVHPSANDRHRHEPPFSQIMEAGCWQYATCDHMAGEIIETGRFLAPPDLCRDELRGEDGPPIFQLGGEIEASVFALIRGPWPAPVERWPDLRIPNVAAILQPRPAA
jgi:hypothetical protein